MLSVKTMLSVNASSIPRVFNTAHDQRGTKVLSAFLLSPWGFRQIIVIGAGFVGLRAQSSQFQLKLNLAELHGSVKQSFK